MARQKSSAHHMQSDRVWRLSKEIPISLIIAIGIQSTAIVWWASGITKDVADLKRDVDRQAVKVERVSTLDVELANVKIEMQRLNVNLEKIADKLSTFKGGR